MTWSCTAPGNIQDIDKNFEYQGVIKGSQRKAGNMGFEYSNSVYKFTYTPSRIEVDRHPSDTEVAETEKPKEVMSFH